MVNWCLMIRMGLELLGKARMRSILMRMDMKSERIRMEN